MWFNKYLNISTLFEPLKDSEEAEEMQWDKNGHKNGNTNEEEMVSVDDHQVLLLDLPLAGSWPRERFSNPLWVGLSHLWNE